MNVTARHDFAERRLFGHLATLSLTGSPTLLHPDLPAAQGTPPYLWASIRALPATEAGNFSATLAARRMRLLLLCDLVWPSLDEDDTATLYDPTRAAAELVDALAYLKLSYLDYTDPDSPVAVDDCVITAETVPRVITPQLADGLRRRRVEAAFAWVGRYTHLAA